MKCDYLSTLSGWLNLELRKEQTLSNLYEEPSKLGKWRRKTHLKYGQQHFIGWIMDWKKKEKEGEAPASIRLQCHCGCNVMSNLPLLPGSPSHDAQNPHEV